MFLPGTPLSFLGNKAKGRISKRVFQENKARRIFRTNEHFLPPDTHTHVFISEGKKCSFFRKILRTLFSSNTRFENSPFCLITDTVFNGNLKPFASAYSFTAFTNNHRLCAIVRQFMKLATIDAVECGQ